MAASDIGAPASPEPDAGDETGVLVLRLWWEPGCASGLRARVTSRLDVADSAEHISFAKDPTEIVNIVAAWVEEFVHEHR